MCSKCIMDSSETTMGRLVPRRIDRSRKFAREYIDRSNCRIGMYAEIIKGGKVLSRGFNKKMFDSSIHAEIDALRRLRWQKNGAEGATITVIRYLSNDSFGMSKPCPDCMKALREAGVKRINYFDWDGALRREKIY